MWDKKQTQRSKHLYISPEIKQRIEKIRSSFPTEQALLLPLLHEVQEEHGWINKESMREAAAFLHLPLSKVEEVATFYTMYNKKPVGEYHVQVCTNISCFLRGSDQIVACLEKKLGVHCGETTADGKFTLSEVECLAACGTAPAVQINKDYYEDQTVDSIAQLVDKLREEKGARK
jgi:NADH-quinone oxidoreductase E subunit